MTGLLTLAEARRICREDDVRDKSYRKMGLGPEVERYLRANHRRLAGATFRDYESALDKLCRHFADKRLEDFEPPVGIELLEEFLDTQWGHRSSSAYNKSLSALRSFFEFQTFRGPLNADPARPIKAARKQARHRALFSEDERLAILAAADTLRDRIALRLLFDYGLRKGALRGVRFRDFDHGRRRLTIRTKGDRVREVPIPDVHLWQELERHILEVGAESHHFLLTRRKRAERSVAGAELPEEPMSEHRLHLWFYERQEAAGVVPPGTTSGSRMHNARHTAIQRVLDATGNLKAAQSLAGHASIQTTADIYTDWDIDQLAATMSAVLKESHCDD